MKKFNIGNYKLPHMSPFPFKKIVKKVEKPFDRTPKRLDIPKPIPIRNNGVTAGWNSNAVTSSSGGITPSEREEAKRLLDSVKGTYMDRLHKRTGKWDPEQRKVVFVNKPMSEAENLAEWQREKGEYYVDFDTSGKGSVKMIPRGDDDIPVQSFIKSLDPSQYRGGFIEDLPKDYQDPGLIKGHPLNPFEGYQRAENYRNR